MSDALARIQELETQRVQLNADIDREIEGLKAKAMSELAAMREQLAKFETALHVKPTPQRAPARVHSEIDETDAGNGVREVQENVSADAFKDELAALRNRTQEKRRRLG